MKQTKHQFISAAQSFLSLHRWRSRIVFWGGAITVGIVSALFAIGSDHANDLFQRINSESPYLPLALTPLGLVVIAWITQRFVPGAQGSGIPQAIASLNISKETETLRKQVLSIPVAIAKVFLTLLGMMCGASIGREGPTVHIGAAIMYSVGHWAHFPRHFLDHGLILAGGAAGIAAAFNTPLAGIVFAIEEMARSFEERTSGTMLTAVILAGITALVFLGNYNYFGTTSATLVDAKHWYIIPVCGVLGGALGGLFAKALVSGSRAISPILKRHPILIPAICGLMVAIAGIFSGGTVYGTGYAEAKMVITASGELDSSYPFLKMFATLASYFSGIPGGIFAPSLATGAGFGSLFAQWFSEPNAQTIILLAMVAYFTGVVQTPITAFVIVMEMTNSHAMLLPLMASAFIAYGTSKLFNQEPIYRALAMAIIEQYRPNDPSGEKVNSSPDVRSEDMRDSNIASNKHKQI